MFLAVIIIIVAVVVIYKAYEYDQKLKHEGMTPLKAAFYTSGVVILLVGLAGLSGRMMATGNFAGWLVFNDLLKH